MTDLMSEYAGGVRYLTLNRPQRRNALTLGLVSALAGEVQSAELSNLRYVVLTGAPPSFSAKGGDLDDLAQVADVRPLAVSEGI